MSDHEIADDLHTLAEVVGTVEAAGGEVEDLDTEIRTKAASGVAAALSRMLGAGAAREVVVDLTVSADEDYGPAQDDAGQTAVEDWADVDLSDDENDGNDETAEQAGQNEGDEAVDEVDA